MDWFAKLQLLAIGFICVAYPILLFITIWFQPTYVIISYFVWVACTLGWICVGEKKKVSEFIVPVLIMLLIFTCIYASGYSERDLKEEPFLILAPAISTPAFCYIGYKMACYRQSKRMEQIQVWTRSLDECYKKKVEGSNKVITLIQNTYADEKKIERMLSLLDDCNGSDLQNCFGKKVIEANQESLVQIKDIVVKYSLPMELGNKTLGDILDEMQELKCEYKNKIYAEKQIELSCYKEIKKEHDVVCLRKK